MKFGSREPTWGGARRDASTIEIESLPAEAASRMLSELLAGDLPHHLSDLVIRQAEGNPFFVEVLLESLIDQGVLQPANEGWAVTELTADFAVPDSVQAVLAARIDLLPRAEKAALQAASVIGRVFWTGPVYELVPDLQPDFRALEDRDFIRRRAGSTISAETEYAFKHQLTREVAYAGLPKGRRARLHAGFAAWLERFGGGRDELAALLALHYADALSPADADLAWAGAEERQEELRTKAIAWLRRCARRGGGTASSPPEHVPGTVRLPRPRDCPPQPGTARSSACAIRGSRSRLARRRDARPSLTSRLDSLR